MLKYHLLLLNPLKEISTRYYKMTKFHNSLDALILRSLAPAVAEALAQRSGKTADEELESAKAVVLQGLGHSPKVYKPHSGFIQFSNENRESVNKDLASELDGKLAKEKMGIIGKELGRRWAGVSDSDKKKYETRAKADFEARGGTPTSPPAKTPKAGAKTPAKAPAKSAPAKAPATKAPAKSAPAKAPAKTPAKRGPAKKVVDSDSDSE